MLQLLEFSKELTHYQEGVNTWLPTEKRPEPERIYSCPGDDGIRYTKFVQAFIDFDLALPSCTQASF